MQVSIIMVRALLGAIEHAGASRERFLGEAGIASSVLEDGSTWLSHEDYMRVVAVARSVSGDPALGLRLGEQARSVMFDVVGPLLEHASTLREMFQLMGQYSRLIAVGYDPELHERGSAAFLRFPALQGDHAFAHVTAEFAMTATASMLKVFVGARARPRQVAFAYSAPGHAAEYKRVFAGAERFGQPYTQLEIPRAWLDRAQPYRNLEFLASLKAQADRALSRMERGDSLRERIEQVLTKRGSLALTTREVAQELQMSERSLHRRMRAEGVSYAALVAQHRMDEAKRLLERPSASIQETAFALGFASVAAFHRAFKRWTGMTPKAYQDSF